MHDPGLLEAATSLSHGPSAPARRKLAPSEIQQQPLRAFPPRSRWRSRFGVLAFALAGLPLWLVAVWLRAPAIFDAVGFPFLLASGAVCLGSVVLQHIPLPRKKTDTLFDQFGIFLMVMLGQVVLAFTPDMAARVLGRPPVLGYAAFTVLAISNLLAPECVALWREMRLLYPSARALRRSRLLATLILISGSLILGCLAAEVAHLPVKWGGILPSTGH
jgi:hypothetical protein